MSMLNRSKTKARVLEIAHKTRMSAKFTRVSPDFLDLLEADLEDAIRRRVHAHPSGGRTLKP